MKRIEEDNKLNLSHLRQGNWLRHVVQGKTNFVQYDPSLYANLEYSPWEYKPVIITRYVAHCCNLKSVCNYYIESEVPWEDRYFELEFKYVNEADGYNWECVRVSYHGVYMASIRYLHELQNLYLVLCGEELIISKDLAAFLEKHKDNEDLNFN